MNATTPRGDLRQQLAYVLGEVRRFDRVLLDLEMATLSTGITPDAALCETVRSERAHARAFERRLERLLPREPTELGGSP